ncbi:MAG: ral secretion pathway protein GspL, partial [Pseudomonadota bacterium]
MPRTLGIDIRPNSIRLALVRTTYRRVHLEALAEVQLRDFDTVEAALRAVAAPYMQHHEGVVMALPGNQVYVHRVSLPPAALKQVSQVLPFELEAQIPVDFDELVYDFRVLPREKTAATIEVLAAAAQTTRVRDLIALGQAALGQEPERIGVGPLPLGNLSVLCPALRAPRQLAVVELGDEQTQLIMLNQGVTIAARTLSIGVGGLPENAKQLVAGLKQTLTNWASVTGHPVEHLYVCGDGAAAAGIQEYLTGQLGVPVEALAALQFDEASPENRSLGGRFAKAIALSLVVRGAYKDLDLRRGQLTYQRGYGFLSQKIPLMASLGAILLVSFLFSGWAQSRSLKQEHEVLLTAISGLSKHILDEETEDVDRVLDLLEAGGKQEKDPQPQMDGFDLVVAIAKQLPPGIQHDIEELELARDNVKLRAVVQSTEDAQKVTEAFKKEPCFRDIKIQKITAV